MALSGALVRPFGVKDVFISFSNLPSAQDLQQAKNILLTWRSSSDYNKSR